MWQATELLGVTGGVVLEPGCGRASFLTRAPAAFSGVGIELDPTTAAIAELLSAPRHRIVAADFAKLRLNASTPQRLNASSVDAVIGNDPFVFWGAQTVRRW